MRRYLIPSVAQAASAVAAPFAVTRAAVLAAAVFGALHPAIPEVTHPSAVEAIRHLFDRWDTVWYVNIASNGYRWNGDALQMQNVVFFPLLPMLMRAACVVLGASLSVAGAIVSLAAFFFACVQLWRLVVLELRDRVGEAGAARIAGSTIILLCSYPFALYFGIAYTESVFLLLAVWALLAARRGAWIEAAAAGALAGLTRPNGLVLAAPLAWMAFFERREDLDAGRARASRLLAAIAPLIGTALFSAYLHWRVGDGLAWYKGQAAWHWIAPEAKAHIVAALKTINPPDLYVGFISVCPGLFALIATVPIALVLGPAYALFVAANIVPPIVTHGFMSAGRFTSVLFPLFMWVAWSVRGDRAAVRSLAAVGLAAEIVMAALFFAGWAMV